jgi:hypothetical protein
MRILNKKFWAVFIFSVFCSLSSVLGINAEEITILYTGESHAMLYPCNCPKEPDGGIARRAALIKRIRKDYPRALLLDSGAFFAGGLTDEYTQNTQFDMNRTLINLKAMQLMGYDAAAIGDEEFNFGKEFFAENISKTKLNFLSCNLKSDNVLPFVIKDYAGTKIGVIGATNVLTSQKSEGIEVFEPKACVEQSVNELERQGVNLIVLLSHLGESQDLELVKEIKGIDVVISGHARLKNEPSEKIGETLILRPSWEARRLGKVTFKSENGRIQEYKAEEIRLSQEIPDDPGILSILPKCFSDLNCRKEGSVGICKNPGTKESVCEFAKARKVSLLVITARDCKICDTDQIVQAMKKQFLGLEVSYLYYPDKKAKELAKELNITGLPAYLLGKEVEQEQRFSALKDKLKAGDKFYLLNPEFAGFAYLLNRERKKGKLDLFISLFDEDSSELLGNIRDFGPEIHFLATSKEGKFDAKKEAVEVEEYLRSVCIQKVYPNLFFDYIACRSKNIDSAWWEDCLSQADSGKIRSCAKGDEGKKLLEENIKLNKALHVMFGPTYLLDNYLIFGTRGAPSKEELEKIIKR